MNVGPTIKHWHFRPLAGSRFLNQSDSSITVQFVDGWERHIIAHFRAALDAWEASLGAPQDLSEQPTAPASPQAAIQASPLGHPALARPVSMPVKLAPGAGTHAALPGGMVAPPPGANLTGFPPGLVPPPPIQAAGGMGALPQPPIRPPPPLMQDPGFGAPPGAAPFVQTQTTIAPSPAAAGVVHITNPGGDVQALTEEDMQRIAEAQRLLAEATTPLDQPAIMAPPPAPLAVDPNPAAAFKPETIPAPAPTPGE